MAYYFYQDSALEAKQGPYLCDTPKLARKQRGFAAWGCAPCIDRLCARWEGRGGEGMGGAKVCTQLRTARCARARRCLMDAQVRDGPEMHSKKLSVRRWDSRQMKTAARRQRSFR